MPFRKSERLYRQDTFPFSTTHLSVSSPSPDGYQDHGEDEVLAQQRDDQRGWGDDFHHQQEEHVQADEDRDGQSHL